MLMLCVFLLFDLGFFSNCCICDISFSKFIPIIELALCISFFLFPSTALFNLFFDAFVQVSCKVLVFNKVQPSANA